MKHNSLLISALGVGILCAASVGLVRHLLRSDDKGHKNASNFVESADEVSVSLVNESTGEVVETTGEDILIPIDEHPENLTKKKLRNISDLSETEKEKIKNMVKGGKFTVMVIAKKFHLARRPAYTIYYSIKEEESKVA